MGPSPLACTAGGCQAPSGGSRPTWEAAQSVLTPGASVPLLLLQVSIQRGALMSRGRAPRGSGMCSSDRFLKTSLTSGRLGPAQPSLLYVLLPLDFFPSACTF